MIDDIILVATVFALGVVAIIGILAILYGLLSVWLNKQGRQL